jgi:hypothetical protein
MYNITPEDMSLLQETLENEWEWFKNTNVNEGDGEIYTSKLERMQNTIVQPVIDRINEKLRAENPELLVKEDEKH